MIEKNYSIALVWDTTKSYINYPNDIKVVYLNLYKKNFKKYNFWIDRSSKDNFKNFRWWLTRLASRDERISSLFHNITVYETVKKISKFKKNIKLKINSYELKKLIEKKKFNNVKIQKIDQESLLKKCFLIAKEFLILTVNLILIKFLFKFQHDKSKEINLVDFFEINQKNQKKKYFGNFVKNKNEHFYFIPTFLSYSPKNILKHLRKKNIIFREYFINFSDLIYIFLCQFNNKFNIQKKFLNTDFSKLIKDEFKINANLRSILIAYQNYLLFKNLKKRNYKIGNIISWHENQIIDKGWSLGVHRFFPNVNYEGYSGSTLHPQFFNLSPTKYEFLSGAVPKKISLIGKKYLRSRNQFFKGIKYRISKYNRFDFKSKTKGKYILFLLSGIRNADEILVDFCKQASDKGIKNIRIKFHPILPSSEFNHNFSNEIQGDGSKIIRSSYIVVTSSYTSGLYESMSNNSFTVFVDCCPLDRMLFQELKRYSSKLLFSSSSGQIISQIKKINQKKTFLYQDNKFVKNFFFSR